MLGHDQRQSSSCRVYSLSRMGVGKALCVSHCASPPFVLITGVYNVRSGNNVCSTILVLHGSSSQSKEEKSQGSSVHTWLRRKWSYLQMKCRVCNNGQGKQSERRLHRHKVVKAAAKKGLRGRGQLHQSAGTRVLADQMEGTRARCHP